MKNKRRKKYKKHVLERKKYKEPLMYSIGEIIKFNDLLG